MGINDWNQWSKFLSDWFLETMEMGLTSRLLPMITSVHVKWTAVVRHLLCEPLPGSQTPCWVQTQRRTTLCLKAVCIFWVLDNFFFLVWSSGFTSACTEQTISRRDSFLAPWGDVTLTPEWYPWWRFLTRAAAGGKPWGCGRLGEATGRDTTPGLDRIRTEH